MKHLDEKTKRMLIGMGVIVLIMILIILIASIIGKSKNSSLDYSGIENKIAEAAEKYYDKNKDLLPKDDGVELEISSDVLIQEGYLKELSSYQKNKDALCSAKVYVYKSGDFYGFTPYLDCGADYKTVLLYEKLESIDSLVEVVENGDSYRVYTGDYAENYVKIDDTLWRIIKVSSSNEITLTQAEFNKKTDISVVWDNRFNSEKGSSFGIGNYEVSIIRNSLKEFYNSDAIPAKLKAKIIPQSFCIGGRSATDISKDASTECKKSLEGDYISLITSYDFMNASADSNCKTITDRSCSNYNYLGSFGKTFWLLNVDSETTYQGYRVSGYAAKTKLSTTGAARVMLTINKNAIYVTGEGTQDNPYEIK